MAKMGKLTPEEEARNKMIMRERDRERKRLKRMNPEYRRMEQERDRDRKKARRANEAFRQLEKLRDKIRKERKKGIIVDEAALAQQFNLVPTAPAEPEVVINDGGLTSTDQQQQQQQPAALGTQQQQSQQQQHHPQHHQPQRRRIHIANNLHTTNTNMVNTTSSITITTLASANTNNSNTNNMTNNLTQVTTANMVPSTNPAAAHMSQLNKGLLYPPPNFPHHPLPIPGVALMPSLCHPILHQNLSATFYPQNGIKQEYNETATTHNNQLSPTSGTSGAGSANNSDDHEMNMIEPEIILQTSSDAITVPHLNNHAHAHHLHQQQCNMFSHMAPQAHMAAAHMRAAAHGPHIPSSALVAAVAAVQSQHQQQQQQQQQQHLTSQHTITQQQQHQTHH